MNDHSRDSAPLGPTFRKEGVREFCNDFFLRQPPFTLQPLANAGLISVCLSLVQDYSWMLGFTPSFTRDLRRAILYPIYWEYRDEKGRTPVLQHITGHERKQIWESIISEF